MSGVALAKGLDTTLLAVEEKLFQPARPKGRMKLFDGHGAGHGNDARGRSSSFARAPAAGAGSRRTRSKAIKLLHGSERQLEPSSHQAIKPSGHQAIRPSSHQAIMLLYGSERQLERFAPIIESREVCLRAERPHVGEWPAGLGGAAREHVKPFVLCNVRNGCNEHVEPLGARAQVRGRDIMPWAAGAAHRLRSRSATGL